MPIIFLQVEDERTAPYALTIQAANVLTASFCFSLAVSGQFDLVSYWDFSLVLSRFKKGAVIMNIGSLPRRCRPFCLTDIITLKSQEQYKTQHRSASALCP